MGKIDLKDRKILYQLDLDCRQSNSQIGKKVGLGRDVVAYRIKKMQDEGVIKNFWTVIDTFKLGYNVFRVYFNLQGISIDEKKELIQNFVDYKNSWAVFTIEGPISFGAVIWVNNIYEFYRFLADMLDKFSKYISKKIVSFYVQADEYEKSYLLSDDPKKDRVKFTISCADEKVEIDEIDYKILDFLSLNARMPLIDIADKLKTTSQTVNYRLKKLKDYGIIKGFRVGLDLSKFGLQYFDVRINLADYSYRKKIIDYLKPYPFFKCVNTAFGYSDLEIELYLENIEKLSQLIDDLNAKFPHIIRDYHYLKTRETHKERWLPQIF